MEGKKVKQIILVFDDDDTMCLETVSKEEESNTPPPPQPIIEEPTDEKPPKQRAKNIKRIEDNEKIVYTYQKERVMKNGETKLVTETRTHWKYPSVNEPRREHFNKWRQNTTPELLNCPTLTQYHDYCAVCKEDNVKPFCYNVFAGLLKRILN